MEREVFLAATLPRLEAADTALHGGDPGPRIAMWSRRDPVTLFGAALSGTGWEQIGAVFERLERVAARVGSDVPFFVRGGAQWAEGRGERLTPARAPRFAALLTMPAAGLSTGAVYARFDEDPPPVPAGDDEPPAAMPELGGWLRNDLWPAARALAPGLAEREAALRDAGAPAVLLCGSGACLAGIFPDRAAAERAAERLDAPGFRAVAEPAPPR